MKNDEIIEKIFDTYKAKNTGIRRYVILVDGELLMGLNGKKIVFSGKGSAKTELAYLVCASYYDESQVPPRWISSGILNLDEGRALIDDYIASGKIEIIKLSEYMKRIKKD